MYVDSETSVPNSLKLESDSGVRFENVVPNTTSYATKSAAVAACADNSAKGCVGVFLAGPSKPFPSKLHEAGSWSGILEWNKFDSYHHGGQCKTLVSDDFNAVTTRSLTPLPSDGTPGSLSECQATCTNDTDCMGNLKCWDSSAHMHATWLQTPPGCQKGDNTKRRCYASEKFEQLLPIRFEKNSGKLGECQGACVNHSDCQTGLRCHDPPVDKDTFLTPPGCAVYSGTIGTTKETVGMATKDKRVCYNPNKPIIENACTPGTYLTVNEDTAKLECTFLTNGKNTCKADTNMSGIQGYKYEPYANGNNCPGARYSTDVVWNSSSGKFVPCSIGAQRWLLGMGNTIASDYASELITVSKQNQTAVTSQCVSMADVDSKGLVPVYPPGKNTCELGSSKWQNFKTFSERVCGEVYIKS